MSYIASKPYQTHRLNVSDIHTISIEECGNPQGKPVLFLHGGPGGRVSEKSTIFFNPEKYRLILFDQRGCGKSTPFADLRENTIFDLVSDIEKIREYLNINTWIIFGGSFGSTLALAYAIAHPTAVEHLVLRGIFLGRKTDIHWLYQEGASYFFPENFEQYLSILDQEEQKKIVRAYYQRLTSEDKNRCLEAAKHWSRWEMGLISLVPKPIDFDAPTTDADLSLARLECHYFVNGVFENEDNYILNHIETIKNIPTDIVHGRYDVDCRPSGAFELYNKLNQANLNIVDAAGHSPFDPPMEKALVDIMDRLISD